MTAHMDGKDTGRLGENAARKFLEERGLRFRAANVRSPLGEVDLIMEDAGCKELVFVEVKTRRGEMFGRPAEALTRKKQLRLQRLIAWYCERFRWNGSVRLDVVEVVFRRSGEPDMTHIPYVGPQ